MLEYSHGEIGWDVFTLEYKVDPPIDTVISADDMINYMKLFSHMWKMRRIETSLAAGWMRIAGASRSFLKLPGMYISSHLLYLLTPEKRLGTILASRSNYYDRDDTHYPSDADVHTN